MKTRIKSICCVHRSTCSQQVFLFYKCRMIRDVWKVLRNCQSHIARKFLNQVAKNIQMRNQKKSEIYFISSVNWITEYLSR